jgi:hypothetical protein
LFTTAYPFLEANLLQDYNEQITELSTTITKQESKKKCQTQLQQLQMPSLLESAFFNCPSNYQIDNLLMPEATASFAQNSSTMFTAMLPQETIDAQDFLNWASPISEHSMNYSLSPSSLTVSPLLDTIPMMVSTSNSSHYSEMPSVYSEMAKLPISKLTKKRKEHMMDRDELLRQVEDKRRRNTESARRSRERKSMKMNELERLLTESEEKRKALELQVQQLLAEKQQLLLRR